MANTRGDFFFRNRRWLLAFLILAVWFSLPASRDFTSNRIARFLFHVTGGPSRRWWEHAVYAVAALLVGLGAFWRTWGSAYLGTSVVQDRHLHTERLVADGPYRRTRNPLYFGNLFFAAGFAIVLAPVTGAILFVGMWVLVRLFIRDEEAGLEKSRGEPYRAYRAAVPRLVPAWRAQIPAGDARPRWVQGFCGESVLWMFTVLMADHAIMLNRQRYGRYVLVGVLIVLPLFLWARRRSRREMSA